MLVLATDWATISSLATGAGTLVLACATFASIRSANRSARIAEAALQEQRRPILAPSRLDDPPQKIVFADGHWLHAKGAHAAAAHVDGAVYLAISLRNVGSGIAVCQGWVARSGFASLSGGVGHAEVEDFRPQTRDLYIPPGDIGMWQGALRGPADEQRYRLAAAIDAGEPVTVELLYSDQVGNQRTITRFTLLPAEEKGWFASMSRHWHLDWDGPRREEEIQMAREMVIAEHEAAEREALRDRADAVAPEPVTER
jgi:hypothetical protein